MKAADIMTTRLVKVRPDATISQAIALMLEKRISGLPVVAADGTLAGVVTEGDFLRRSEVGTTRHRPRWLELLLGPGRLAEEFIKSHAKRVEDIMTRDVATVDVSAPIDAVVAVMEKHHVKRVPVLREGKLAGLISRANLLRALQRMSAKGKVSEPHSIANDTLIRDRILAEIDRQIWAPKVFVDVVVWEGVVHLRGNVFDDRDRQALRVLAENIEGVEAVEDHLNYVPLVPAMLV
jgi:CBS domain-containing protein